MAVHWTLRLRGRWREHLFVSLALPLAYVGFLGGFLFHGTRARRLWLGLDIFPMVALFLATAGYAAWRCTGRRWAAAAAVAALFLLHRACFRLGLPRATAITLSYAVAALAIALPLVLLARRQGGGRDLAAGIGLVAFGLAANVLDPWLAPTGGHWLWHVCAAAAVHFLLRFLTAVVTPGRGTPPGPPGAPGAGPA